MGKMLGESTPLVEGELVDAAEAVVGPVSEETRALATELAREPLPGEDLESAVAKALQEIGARDLPSGPQVWEAARQGLELDKSLAVQQQLGANRLAYENPTVTKEDLIQACLDRDRIIMQLSRDVSEGKLGGRLIGEFVRGILYQMEAAGQRVDRLRIEEVVREIGGLPTDRRMIKGKGTGL